MHYFTNRTRLRAAFYAGALALPIGAATPALAQDQADSNGATEVYANSATNREIVVTALTSLARLDREDARKSQAESSNTGAILGNVPGVSVNSGGGFSGMPAIRGLNQQRISITVDGQTIDLSCPNDMNSPLSYTDPHTVGQIDVLTGVAPVSFGGDQIGGIIKVESPAPRFSNSGKLELSGEASSFYRSNGDGFGGGVTLTAAGEHLSATYSGSFTQSDNYDAGGNGGMVRSTEYKKTDHALGVAWHSPVGMFKVKGGFQYSPREGFPTQAMDMVENKSWFVNGSYEGFFNWGSARLSADYRDTDHTMNFLADKLPGAMPMITEVHSFGAQGALNFALSDGQELRVGGEYKHQWLNDYWPPVAGNMMMGPNTYVNLNGATRDRIGGYVELESRLGSTLTGVVGLRYDRVTMDTGDVAPYGSSMMQMPDVMAAAAFNARDHYRADDNVSGSAILVWRPEANVSVELGYAHKTRAPNLYERYTWGRTGMASRMTGWFGDGNGYIGNLDLKPEKADTVSLSVAVGQEGGALLKIAPYYTRVDDYIDAVFVQRIMHMSMMPTPWVQLQFANQDAEFYGLNVSAVMPLRRGAKADEGTDLTGSFAWTAGNNLTDGGPVYHQMPFEVRVGAVHRQGGLEAGVDLNLVTEKTRVDATRNEPRTDGYVLVDARIAYSIGPVRLSVSGTNLFDVRYDLPLGGINIADYKQDAAYRPLQGMGRSINVGFGVRF